MFDESPVGRQDTGDASFDSTVLIDNFQWLAEPVEVGTDPVD